MEELDLSKNKLTGNIPQEFSKLTKLASLNVSSNRLCGPIPKGGQWDTFSPSSFEENDCLCGYNPLHACKEKEIQPKGAVKDYSISKGRKWLNHVNNVVSLIAVGLGVGIGFIAVVSVIIIWDKAKNWVMPPRTEPFYGEYQFPT